MPSCRLLPHGAYSLVPAVFATLAWLCSISQDGCDFARLEGPIVREITNSEIIPFLEIGFVAYRKPQYHAEDDSWRVLYAGTCLFFDSSIQDSYWTAAKALAFVALVLGGAGALFVCFSTCFVFSRATWRWAGYQIMLACLCQCLSFLWFATDICYVNSCDLFFGSKADICASVFYLGAGLLILTRYPNPTPKVDNRQFNPPQVETTDTGGNGIPLEGHAPAVLPATTMEESQNGLFGFKDADAELL